jgi:hypothetical protein
MSLRRTCVVGVTFLGSLGAGFQLSLMAQETSARHIYIQIPAGTLGDASKIHAVTSNFRAATDIRITRLGVFDSGSDGLASTLSVQIYLDPHSGPLAEPLGEATFTPESPGELVGGSRFKESVIELPAGTDFLLLMDGVFGAEPPANQENEDLGIRADDADCAIEGGVKDGYPTVVQPTFEFEVLAPLPVSDRRPPPPVVTADPGRLKVLVSWRKQEVAGCVQYPLISRLFRSVGGEPFSEIALHDPIRDYSYLDEDLASGVQVCYVMRSVAERGLEGVDSAPVCVEPFPDVGPVFLRGDADQSGRLNITDPIRVLNSMFKNPDELVRSCPDAAETNDNGVLDISDPVYLLNFLMAGGPAPRPPFPACGLDPTEDALGCSGSPAC